LVKNLFTAKIKIFANILPLGPMAGSEAMLCYCYLSHGVFRGYPLGIMSSDQLDFVTYCIGNLSIRLQLPQKAIYARLKSTGILDDYIVKGYDVLHTFGKEYLMEDLISYMQEKGALS
jgi:hypothetical protein